MDFFSTEGRIRRSIYFLRVLMILIPWAIINTISSEIEGGGSLILTVSTSFVCSILFIIQAIKRIHDINLSGAYWLLFLIPLFNAIFAVYIFVKPGTIGENNYGTDPKQRERSKSPPEKPISVQLMKDDIKTEHKERFHKKDYEKDKPITEKFTENTIKSDISILQTNKEKIKSAYEDGLFSESEFHEKKAILEEKEKKLEDHLKYLVKEEKEKEILKNINKKIEPKLIQLKELLHSNIITNQEFLDKEKHLFQLEWNKEIRLDFEPETFIIERDKATGLFGYKNPLGEVVIDCKFDDAFPFHEGLAAVIVNNKRGYIDKNGQFLIEPQFDRSGSYFKNGKAEVWISGKKFLISKNGKLIDL